MKSFARHPSRSPSHRPTVIAHFEAPVLPASVPVRPTRGHAIGIAPLAPVIALREFKAHCQTCSMRELCLPVAFNADQMMQFDALVVHRTKLKKYDTLFRAGDAFHALYAIQFGSLKTSVLAEDGREQVTGYHMLGEIIGFDGIGTDRHGAGAIALEDTEVCALPFDSIAALARTMSVLQHNLHQLMATEINRDHGVMLMLGSMSAEERLAMFLLNLAERYRRRGYSSTDYVLRLTREEIGSYLGLKLETVSRLFSRFQEDGLLQVQGRAVKLLDPVRLKWTIGQRA